MELDTAKITAEVIAELSKNIAGVVYNKTVGYFSDLSKKDEVTFGTAFETYLARTKAYYEKSKTILYGREPKNLYTFYECIGVEHAGRIVETDDINHLLDIGHKLIVTGTGGIGKSIMMKHFFLNTIMNQERIPVLVELRGLNEFEAKDIELEQYIYHHVMRVFHFRLEEKYFTYSLETGRYVFLFDGYDEVKNILSDKVSSELIQFCNRYSDNYYIVSSRPLPEFHGWSDFVEVEALPLNKKQALALIDRLDYEKNIKKKFYKALDEELFEKYESFASNPLLLTIMLMTFEDRVSIPDHLNDFYDQAFAALFHKHDAYKGAYQREKESQLGYEEFKKVFSYFCFQSFFHNRYEFSESAALDMIEKAKDKFRMNFSSEAYLEDLTNAVCMLVHEGLNYRFTHRSFQEYFAAVYVMRLTDTQQETFLTEWLKKESRRMTSSFLNMLCDMQPERFAQNVLRPGLKVIEKYYHNPQKDVVQTIYSGISINKIESEKEGIFIRVENSYLYQILSLTLDMIGFDYVESMERWDAKRNSALEYLKQTYRNKRQYDFQELAEDENYAEIRASLGWVDERIETAMRFLKTIGEEEGRKKKRFESMLEEL